MSNYSRISDMFRYATGQEIVTYGDYSAPPEPDPNPLAIVTVPEPNAGANLSHVSVTPRGVRKYPVRSAELVRVSDLKPDDVRFFRESIRKARMIFDSLRVFAVAEDEKHRDMMAPHRRTRADLKAATMMKERGLWLNRDKRVVGDIPGVEIGDVFFFRMELCVLGLHGQAQAGIDYVPISQSSNGEPIATSIIVSGGYEDDEDAGDVIVYTGHGGQDKHGRQVEHQRLECGNLGLEVVETWFDVGKSGFGVYKFKIVRSENQEEMGSAVMRFASSLRTRPLEARPTGYVSLDLSNKKENFPVFFYNDVDGVHDPIYYEYLITTVFPPFVYNSGSSSGCECVGGCTESCLCAMKNGGEFAYDQGGILVRGRPLVFECGPHCRCPPTCRNRVAQKGMRNRFELFRSRETDWGVRSLDLIPAGSFICEYTGVVLTREQVQLVTMNGDSLVYPRRFSERWKEWGNLSDVFADFVTPSYPSIPPLDFAMDVSRMRNVACYMSHSSSPNVFVQLVLYDHNNVSFPHLMLFAMENIPPMRELSLDYGVADEGMGKLAICN
ncbi:histone-lysine n-methyltransferase family member suvh9 [Phtheirospermum japonicum]|uniref:Histone-lysine n-methyltransferase family member suvh9 n=1 Tax=Phtheirospermum japonicum TaxID=374723 RepID=A0A830BBL9_9LAMI|nr:histone-lysine n-methyltransferase family member suvh9 [Phtheirospermum japonicum]